MSTRGQGGFGGAEPQQSMSQVLHGVRSPGQGGKGSAVEAGSERETPRLRHSPGHGTQPAHSAEPPRLQTTLGHLKLPRTGLELSSCPAGPSSREEQEHITPCSAWDSQGEHLRPPALTRTNPQPLNPEVG